MLTIYFFWVQINFSKRAVVLTTTLFFIIPRRLLKTSSSRRIIKIESYESLSDH